MINIVWFCLMSVGIIVAAATGRQDLISSSIFANAGKAIEFTIGLAGIIAFWSGILKIAEASGVTEEVSKLFQPFLARLFPKIPKGHPVLGLISMTVTANLFGLGNVATPLGLQTMSSLKELNTKPNTASAETCTFMALVFGGLSIVPSTLIAIRARAGSTNPALILVPVFLLSLTGTFIGLCINYLALRKSQKQSTSKKENHLD